MHRINTLIERLHASGIDALFIASEANISYLTGFTGDSSRLIVSSNGTYFLTDGRYTEQAEQECHGEIEILKWLNDNRYGTETYHYVSEKLNIRRMGFEEDILTFHEFTALKGGINQGEAIAVSGLVEGLRMVKDESEITWLKEACRITDLALEKLIPTIKPDVTELELSARLEYELKMAGSEGISFDTIVLFGSRTSLLHGKPGSSRLKQGDLILFDFGGMKGGYHADMSRTFVMGKATEEQKDLYHAIKRAQESAVASTIPGVPGKHPDSVAREALGDKYLVHYYPGLGHGVGLEIHEQPFLKHTCETMLEKGMTVTVEPGCYIPGWGGIRIEDTIVVRDHAPEVLTAFRKDLVELR